MPPPCLFGLCHCCAHLLCLCHSRSCLVSSLPCRCYSPSYRSAPRPCHVPLCLAFAMRNLASPCHCHATVLSALPPHRSLHRVLALAFRFTSALIRCCSSGCGAVQFLCRAHTFCSMPSHCATPQSWSHLFRCLLLGDVLPCKPSSAGVMPLTDSVQLAVVKPFNDGLHQIVLQDGDGERDL